jgi:hypoxanthine phosphoribosyltransferase
VSADEAPAEDRSRHPSAFRAARVEFAHPSERVFATLLDLYGLRWRYEPFEFPLAWDDEGRPTRAFRPDFYLPDHRMLVELTVADQRLVTRKNAKVRRMRELYPELEVAVVYQRDLAGILERHGLEGLLDPAA